MSVEEMIKIIKAVQRNPNSPVRYNDCDEIIAALKAGRIMREQITLDDDGFIDDMDGSMFLEGLRAWDAATKEDV